MERIVWEGQTRQGTTLRIIDKSSETRVHFEARDDQNSLLAGVFAQHKGNDQYELDSNKTEFDMASENWRWGFKIRGQGLGKTLIALVLKGIAERKGTRATIRGIENAGFRDSLANKLDGEAHRDKNASILFDLVWEQHKLTRPEDQKQPWHDYLPDRGKQLR